MTLVTSPLTLSSGSTCPTPLTRAPEPRLPVPAIRVGQAFLVRACAGVDGPRLPSPSAREGASGSARPGPAGLMKGWGRPQGAELRRRPPAGRVR